jgi:spoIIIJ-associated protein
MAPFLEFEEKNVEKAVKKASQELKIKEDKLKYDIISYGSTGIFGLVGAKQARIRVNVPEKKRESGRKGVPKELVSEPTQTAKETEAMIDDALDTVVIASDASPELEIAETFIEDDEEEGPEFDETEQVQVPFSFEENFEAGKRVLQRILESISEEVAFTCEAGEDRALFVVKGGNSGAIIGKRGQTLEAIQYILDKIINKGSEKKKRVEIDVEGYLEMRQAGLQSLAERLSEKAKKTGKPVVLGQMNSYERRIVHVALKDDDSVRTQSIGNGFYRKMVIYPKKNTVSKESE